MRVQHAMRLNCFRTRLAIVRTRVPASEIDNADLPYTRFHLNFTFFQLCLCVCVFVCEPAFRYGKRAFSHRTSTIAMVCCLLRKWTASDESTGGKWMRVGPTPCPACVRIFVWVNRCGASRTAMMLICVCAYVTSVGPQMTMRWMFVLEIHFRPQSSFSFSQPV